VTAMLVLPGATALLISERLRTVIVTAVMVGILGAAAGVVVNLRWHFVPAGPAIVLSMFGEFMALYVAVKLRPRHGAD